MKYIRYVFLRRDVKLFTNRGEGKRLFISPSRQIQILIGTPAKTYYISAALLPNDLQVSQQCQSIVFDRMNRMNKIISG